MVAQAEKQGGAAGGGAAESEDSWPFYMAGQESELAPLVLGGIAVFEQWRR
jgi:hypothetical protein